MKSKSTKKALTTSIISILLCLAMFIGSTFAWFTDTASTTVNKIQAGSLDVDIVDASGNSLNGKTLSFKNVNNGSDILWEPGATFNLDSFKIVNKGNLALKYEVKVNGVTGNAKLLKAIDFKAKVRVGDVDTVYSLSDLKGNIVPAGKTAGTDEVAGETGLITIYGKMKEDAGNEYQGLSLDGIGITVVATQYAYESDSNGNTYDNDADATIKVNKDNIQDYLDGKYGTIDGATLVLAEGDYGKLELGRATKYAGSNTQYFNTPDGFNGTPVDLETLKANHSNRYYMRSMSNVTFKAADEATVKIAGIEMKSGAFNGTTESPRYDYVLDEYFNGGNYYLAHKVYNITFEGITFTAKSYINGGNETTVINGFTFESCTFDIGNTSSDAYQALNYRAESGVSVSNLVVKNCKFYNCYQGVYTQNVKNVTVSECTFDTTGHNAIQNAAEGTFDLGAIVITNNTFNKIGDRIIRFGNVGANTQFTITANTATESGDGSNEIMKASSLAAGITYNISGNNWGTKNGNQTKVSNDELKDRNN